MLVGNIKSLQDLIISIRKWADERNLIGGSTPQKQAQKLAEEVGELCKGLNKCDVYLIKDALGDCFIASVVFSLQCKVKLNINNIDDRVISNYEFYLSGLLERVGKFISPFHPINNGFMTLSSKAEIDDLFFCLFGLAETLNFDLAECVNQAYEEIKNRKGTLIGGIFVKEEDLLC